MAILDHANCLNGTRHGRVAQGAKVAAACQVIGLADIDD